MNVMQNKKASKAAKGTRTYRSTLNFEVFEQANPDRVVNQKVLKDISSKDVFGNTTSSGSSGNSQLILALTEGRGHARCEIGIAALDTHSPTLLLCQISDNLHYSDALNKIQILNPVKILLLDTMFGMVPLPKLITLLQESFQDVQLLPVKRQSFNEKLGLEQISKFSSRLSKNILQIIAKKYYCLSAASALLSYLKEANSMTFGDNCLRVDYQTKQFAMMIDTQTATQLELLYTLSSERNALKKFSLFSILNNCVTRIGQRTLRAAILEPSCNIDFIRNRQEQIKVLMENGELMESLKESINNFRSVDQLLKISCIVPADDCKKAIETNIQMSVLLKTCLEGVKPLCDVLTGLVSDSYESTRQVLSATVIAEIIEKIDGTVQPDIHKNRLAQKHFQHLFAVKANVDTTVDFLRTEYKETADEIRDYVTKITEESQLPIKLIFSTKLGHHLYMKCPPTCADVELPESFQVIQRKTNNIYLTTSQLMAFNEKTRVIASDIIQLSNSIVCDMLIQIASEVDAIAVLIGTIIDLDLVQSMTEVAKQRSYCCPTFSKVMQIEEAYHPMLEYTKNIDSAQSIITNNVIATPQYNFYLLSGPNMSGKTVYLKMIALIQIMAQIGSFVPCKSAKIRMTDKIFSRIGFHDSIEQSASSFTVELREMEYIYSNLTPNSLVIIDELCRSTSPEEGEMICWKFCEKLLKAIGISNENYFKAPTDDKDDDGLSKQNKSINCSLQLQGANLKLSDVSRPFFYLTTHFKSLSKLSEKFNNAINLHMLTLERSVDGKPFLEFKYKIQSGKSNVSNYGLALARCLRFPRSLIKRAEEIIEQVEEESYENDSHPNRSTDANETLCTSMKPSEVMTGLEKDAIDLYSYILLLMSSTKDQQTSGINVDVINHKLKSLVDKMSPDFQKMLKNSSLDDVLDALNASFATSSGG